MGFELLLDNKTSRDSTYQLMKHAAETQIRIQAF